MGDSSPGWFEPATLDAQHLDALIQALRGLGYIVVGPRVRDGALLYQELETAAQLPAGWIEDQGPGRYRLRYEPTPRFFGAIPGPDSWKRWLHPPLVRLWRAERRDDGLHFVDGEPAPRPLALIGVRSCELGAIARQDRVLLDTAAPDVIYRARRTPAFVVAVQCGRAGGTCFCASMGTGPRARGGFDLALTEVLSGDRHWFRVEVATERGAEVMALVPHGRASGQEVAEAERVLADVPSQMGRRLDVPDLPGRLAGAYEHGHWVALEQRCLACGNCTQVCPTCFCVTVEDRAALDGATSDRVRRWDTCFSADFSYIHGGSVRPSVQARYRQWLTHKLSTWHQQFDSSGCVGCGRCITWCPVGIDITEEAAVVAAGHHARRETHARSRS